MFELVLQAPQALVDDVCDALADALGALSVAVEDAAAGSPAEQPLFGEPGLPAPAPAWEQSTLTALFDDAAAAERAATWLLAQHGADGVALQRLAELADRDWVRLTQSQFAPVQITPVLWIVPSWHAPPPQARLAIRLDPGLAFGTGPHPTTRMCLRWLATRTEAAPPARVLDYGCGSGILAIAAARLGAARVDAVDIDPAAVQATRANAAANDAALDRVGAPDAADGRYDVVLANILATPLKLLAPLLAGHVAPAGRLVLAGILERQAGDVAAAYAPWLTLAVADRDDGWVLMVGSAPAAAEPAA